MTFKVKGKGRSEFVKISPITKEKGVGTVPLPPKNRVDFELPVEQTLIVPSTKNFNEPISEKELYKRTKEVETFLSKKFGGYTQTKAEGGYYSDDKNKIVEEKVIVVKSYSTREDYLKNRKALFKQIDLWKKKWGQESIGYELENDLYYMK